MSQLSERIGLNRGWEFTEAFSEAFLRGEDVPVEAAELPHTVKTTPFHYFDESVYQMVSGYRRTLSVPAEWAGKRVFLTLGAAGHRILGMDTDEHVQKYALLTGTVLEELTEETVSGIIAAPPRPILAGLTGRSRARFSGLIVNSPRLSGT